MVRSLKKLGLDYIIVQSQFLRPYVPRLMGKDWTGLKWIHNLHSIRLVGKE